MSDRAPIRFDNIFEPDMTSDDHAFLGPFQERTHNVNNARSIAFALILLGAAALANAHALGLAGLAVCGAIALAVTFTRPTRFFARIGIADPARRVRAQAIVAAILIGAGVSAPLALGWNAAAHSMSLLTAFALIVFGPIAYAHTPAATKAFAAIAVPMVAAAMVVGGGVHALPALALLLLFAATSLTVCRFTFSNFATRFVRERDLGEAVETVRLLLHDYQTETSDWLWEVDRSGKFTNHSKRGLAATGMSIEELQQVRPIDLLHRPTDRARLIEIIQSRQPFRDFEFAIMIKGEERWWKLSGTPQFDDNGDFQRTRGVCSDVTEAKRADAKIAYMARYDALTDLPNRTMFAETLARALQRQRSGSKLAVLYLDLDHFKAINDTLGHAAGDAVLKEAAQRIGSCLGLSDVVSRQGGDEFAVLLPEIGTAAAAEAIAARIIDAMAQPLIINEQAITLGASVGIAVTGKRPAYGEDLLKQADLALYAAKQRGRGQFAHFAPYMHREMQQRRQVEIDLRKAVTADDQLELHYQPLINLASGATVGYEALLRWHHPTRGLINPDDFIPVAEDTGLIIPIGEWVIRSAVAEVRRWPENLSVSVNLSPLQLGSPGLVPTIINALAANGVAPHRLEVEITETVLMNDSEANLRVLHQLRSLGIQIALDDFGTGYSSLNYLRGFPFDKIKIDRCFVNELDSRDDNKAIIRAVTGLAASLGMVTTAEGVERAEELELLRAEGCTEVQGFYFSRPIRAADIGERLQESLPEDNAESASPPEPRGKRASPPRAA